MDTKTHIIQTAAKMFYSQGYNLTGINAIIEESGIAKATLYNHFKSKEDLMMSYLDYKDEQLLVALENYCSKKSEGSKQLIAIFEFLEEFFNKKDFNGCWCIRSIAEVPKTNKRIRIKIKENKNKFRAFIFSLVKENKPLLTATKQKNLSNYIYLLYESAVTESHLQNESWPIKDNLSLLKIAIKSLEA